MSGSNIDKKVAKGYGKLGKKLGFASTIFRPDTYYEVLSDRNKFSTAVIAWSEDKGFEKNPEGVLVPFIIFSNYQSLLPGDFILNEKNDCLVVTEVNPIRGAIGFKVQSRINVFRTVFTPDDDIKTSFNQFITNLPVALEYKSSSSTDGALKATSSSMKSGQSNIEVWTWITPGTIKISDVIEANGNKFQVTAVNSTDKGTKLQAIASKAGT